MAIFVACRHSNSQEETCRNNVYQRTSRLMIYQRHLFILILCCCFCLVGFGKPKKAQKYWRPSNIFTNRSLGSLNTTTSESLALHRVIKSENQRIESDPYLNQAAFHASKQVSKTAILALGRIGNPNSIETLSRVLNSKNSEMKMLAAFSLGQIGDELCITLLSQHAAMEKKAEVRGAVFRAIGFSRKPSALPLLAKAIETEGQTEVLRNIVEGLGILLSGDSSSWDVPEELLKKVAVLALSSPRFSGAASFALSQYKGDSKKIPTAQIIQSISKANNPFYQALLVRALSRSEGPEITTFLISKITSTNSIVVRVEATKALKGRKLEGLGLSLFQKNLTETPSPLLVTSLEAIEAQPAAFINLTDSVESLAKKSSSLWIKVTALRTLVKLAPEKARDLALQNLKSNEPLLVATALASLIGVNKAEDWQKIRPYFVEGDSKHISLSLEMLTQNELDIHSDLKTTLKDLIFKKDPGVLALIAQLAAQKGWKDFAQPLADAYKAIPLEDTVETRTAIIQSLSSIGSEDQINVVDIALKDREKQVVIAAFDAAKAINGKEPQIIIPINSKVSHTIPEFNVWRPASGKLLVLRTNRGTIEIKFFEDSPMTAHHLVDLISKHFYDEKLFHRVVPNFVVQGGDPRGDGFGGPGFLIRDEFSPRNHERGTVGIATAGKDTGGSQFFFNTFPNYHLNGRYTVFGEITSGLDVVDRLELGDKIISATVK